MKKSSKIREKKQKKDRDENRNLERLLKNEDSAAKFHRQITVVIFYIFK